MANSIQVFNSEDFGSIRAIKNPDGHVTINRTPKVTGKGQRYFIDRHAPKKLV